MGPGGCVVVDGGVFSRTFFGGATRYVSGLSIGLQQRGHSVVLALPAPPRKPANHLPAGVPTVSQPPPGAIAWIGDDPVAASGFQGTSVLVVHDLIGLHASRWGPTADCPQVDESDLIHWLRSVALVVTPSRTTAEGVRSVAGDRLGVPLLPVPHSVAIADAEPAEVEHPARPFLLHVGGRDGHKRFDLLLGALARSGLTDVDLMSVGGREEFSPAEAELIEHLGLHDRVRSAGYVSDAELAAFYRSAAAVVMPSDEEGFGVPLLEARGLGVPLVASDIPVVREIAGDWAHTFEPGSVPSLAAALTETLAGRSGRAAAWSSGPQAVPSWRECVEPLDGWLRNRQREEFS